MSLTPADIQKLASLSRLKLSEGELSQFTKEIDSILGYVEQIKEVTAATGSDSEGGVLAVVSHKNILREDVADRDLNATGEPLVLAAPELHGGLIKVKKILN